MDQGKHDFRYPMEMKGNPFFHFWKLYSRFLQLCHLPFRGKWFQLFAKSLHWIFPENIFIVKLPSKSSGSVLIYLQIFRPSIYAKCILAGNFWFLSETSNWIISSSPALSGSLVLTHPSHPSGPTQSWNAYRDLNKISHFNISKILYTLENNYPTVKDVHYLNSYPISQL